MFDEIQSGLGRTGKLFAYQHEKDAKPDVLILGKALSGGFYPVSVVLASKEVLGVFNPGDHGSTFGGNPLACAIARSALKVIVEKKLPEQATVKGRYLMAKLKTINCGFIKEIRGKGLMIGIELTRKAKPYCKALAEDGLLCKDTHKTVIRLAPPLTISQKELDLAFEKIKKVLES